MSTLMGLSVFAIVPVVGRGVIGTCDHMHCHGFMLNNLDVQKRLPVSELS
jgi:hypothetical protein